MDIINFVRRFRGFVGGLVCGFGVGGCLVRWSFLVVSEG